MPDQYDAIATLYGAMQDLPAPSLEQPSVEAILGDITGLRCLDLACGLGRWSRFLLEKGAASVTGIDISELMVAGAAREVSTWSPSIRDKAQFRVGDCTESLLDLESEEPFDLVFGAWLLNYAATASEQLGMWRNIHANLRPGGRFIGVTPNVNMDPVEQPIDDRYGYAVVPVKKVEDGYKCRLTAYTQPEKVEFEMYHLSKQVYEQSAAEAGLLGLTWNGYVIPEDGRKAGGYWDAFEKRSSFEICIARRPVL
jgi:SAM-dependent methyltransferase